MKIYINTDLEGICGVFSQEHLFNSGRFYPEARQLITDQVNAAIEGAYAGGADEVIVLDGHGGGGVFIISQMDERAQYIQGSGRPHWIEKLGECDGLFEIGVHAMAGTPDANLDHTQSLAGVQSMIVNGLEVGEIGQVVLTAGAWGIPLLMVAGDNKACAEAAQLVPGIRQAVIKQAIARFSAMHMHPKAACRLIKQEAKEGVKLVDKIKPYELTKPITVDVRLSTTDIAQSTLRSYSSRECEASLIDSRTVRYVADDIRKIWP